QLQRTRVFEKLDERGRMQGRSIEQASTRAVSYAHRALRKVTSAVRAPCATHPDWRRAGVNRAHEQMAVGGGAGLNSFRLPRSPHEQAVPHADPIMLRLRTPDALPTKTTRLRYRLHVPAPHAQC